RPADPLQMEVAGPTVRLTRRLVHMGRCSLSQAVGHSGLTTGPLETLYRWEDGMATETSQTSRPGVSVGPTSEFSLFFQVTPGHGDDLREALRTLQDHPGYLPGEYHMAIATIHEASFVLFDDDTRLLFATSFDGPWDAYMVDFFLWWPTLQLLDWIFH